jgi:hypothetical protein
MGACTCGVVGLLLENNKKLNDLERSAKERESRVDVPCYGRVVS